MEFVGIVLSSIFSLLVLNVVMLVFMRHSENIKLSRILMILGSLIYVFALISSSKFLFISGQMTIFVGISFGIYGLYSKRVSNLPVLLFSISFIIIEIFANIFDIKVLIFSRRFSGLSFSTALSLSIPLLIGFYSNYLINKKRKK